MPLELNGNQDEVGPHDAPIKKDYSLENGSTITAKRTDPYGFWYMSIDKGFLPEKFRGAYTSTQEVERAIRDYSNNLKQEAIKLKEEAAKLFKKELAKAKDA